MNITTLSRQISAIDRTLGQSASKAVNTLLTARNWLIGFHIVEYEHDGQDRAAYGESITKELAKRLDTKGLSARNLWLFRQFFLTYPQIGHALVDRLPDLARIVQTPSALSATDVKSEECDTVPAADALSASAPSSVPSKIVQTPSALFGNSRHWQNCISALPEIHVPGPKLLSKLSFSHLSLILSIEDPLKRAFYEIEAIKGTWSVRELKRQIASLFYERSGMSADPAVLAKLTRDSIAPPSEPRHLTKDLYTFEFLGIPHHHAVEESDLETALLDHLQDFLIELGHGFCLEARQKRILLGDEYFFVDLVFYHRLLKCHVLIELKVGEFSHENAGQLNAYLNYYRAEVMAADDNPPVGLLLVAEKNNPLVEYAIAGMDENLFVKKYLLQLPDKATLKNFINRELNTL